MNAALAASRGYRCELRLLEMRGGFFETVGGADGEAAGAEALRDLGESWDIVTDMAIKLVPGGHPYHALAEAAANAAREGNIAAEEITSITVSRPGMTALHGPLHPIDLIDMAHSPAYFTAAGAADGTFSWEHADAAKIADPVIHRLIDLVRVGDPPQDDAAQFRQGARVTIRARDGREATSTGVRSERRRRAGNRLGRCGCQIPGADAALRIIDPGSGRKPDDDPRTSARFGSEAAGRGVAYWKRVGNFARCPRWNSLRLSTIELAMPSNETDNAVSAALAYGSVVPEKSRCCCRGAAFECESSHAPITPNNSAPTGSLRSDGNHGAWIRHCPVKRPKPSARRFHGIRSRRPPLAVAGLGSSARSRTVPPEPVSCRSGPAPVRHRPR